MRGEKMTISNGLSKQDNVETLLLRDENNWLETDSIETLPLNLKVGQLFMTCFYGDSANEDAERLIKEMKIGGFIFYNWSNGLDHPKKIQNLSHQLQELSQTHIGIPPFLAVDQEGGRVARLRDGFTKFPGNDALGKAGVPELVYKSAYYSGLEMSCVGLNFNLAPVVDVNSNPENPVIGSRSFGSDVLKVSEYGKQALLGYKDSGIIPCLKHFPGHGDTTSDSHHQLPIVDKEISELNEVEFVPYEKLVSDTPAIMTAHILFPKIDKERCATLSPIILKDLLRDKMQFDGVIISDSLAMKGANNRERSLEETVIQAFEAGNDILLIGGRNLQIDFPDETDIEVKIRIYQALLSAVEIGRISEKRVNESVNRIFRLKKEAGLFKDLSQELPNIKTILRAEEHLQTAEKIIHLSN